MMGNMELWDKVSKPPKSALKQIKGGRLGGMTDINPQWRLEALTEHFGMCGDGWKYTIDKLWTEQGSDGQICAFALISLYHRTLDGDDNCWSDGIPGIGGSMLIAKESKGLYTSDECYKMAVTDAISVAAKALGFAADIYAGKYDGSKYKDEPKQNYTHVSPGVTLTDNEVQTLKEAGVIPEPFEATTLTFKQLMDKMKTSENIYELKNRWKKYNKDIQALSDKEILEVTVEKDKMKAKFEAEDKAL